MARGATLGDLLTGLRVELRLSLNPAHNEQVRDTHVKTLQYVQEWLWEEYTWPHLRVERYLQPQDGQRFYDPAGCKKIDQNTGALVAAGDVSIDNVENLWLRDGDVWRPLSAGIDPHCYNQWDSDAGETAWPIEHWQVAENDNIEFWPVPGEDGNETTLANMVKFVGVRNLSDLSADDDTADLDDQAIILFAAAKLAPAKEASKFLGQAERRMRIIKGNATKKRRHKLFSRTGPKRVLRGPPTVYYRTT